MNSLLLAFLRAIAHPLIPRRHGAFRANRIYCKTSRRPPTGILLVGPSGLWTRVRDRPASYRRSVGGEPEQSRNATCLPLRLADGLDRKGHETIGEDPDSARCSQIVARVRARGQALSGRQARDACAASRNGVGARPPFRARILFAHSLLQGFLVGDPPSSRKAGLALQLAHSEFANVVSQTKPPPAGPVSFHQRVGRRSRRLPTEASNSVG